MMRRLLPLLLLLLVTFTAKAQFLGIGRRARASDVPPKAMVIEIMTRPNQREHLKQFRPDLLPEFERDVNMVAHLTVLDWSTNFSYCPVYFFLDTMSEKLKAGEWDGVLLDSTMQPVSNPVIKPGDRDFYIGYFGSPIPQPDTVRPSTPGQSAGQYMEHDGDDATSIFRERLLINSPDFRLLPERLPRTNYVRAVRPANMNAGEYRVYNRRFTYNAKRWYIDYVPTAYSYDRTLRRFFR